MPLAKDQFYTKKEAVCYAVYRNGNPNPVVLAQDRHTGTTTPDTLVPSWYDTTGKLYTKEISSKEYIRLLLQMNLQGFRGLER